jgi:YD repeat-containing protein
MRKCFKVLTIQFLILISYPVLAQQKLSDLPVIIPPSPNAASLGKFGDIPVSMYTGIPSVSVPLYTAKLGAYTLPISLQYHSQGLKVEESAGWVGLNWSLISGGAITRSIHTLPDEGAGGYLTHSKWTNDSIKADPARLVAFGHGEYDLEPDMFYYNFNGQSGKFILDSSVNHTARLTSYNDISITHNSTLSQFTIIDENGITYIFDANETTTNESNPAHPYNYVSAWYLSKITTPAGDITFSYTPQTIYVTQLMEVDREPTAPDPTTCNYSSTGSFSVLTYTEISALIISEINTPLEKIKFYISNTRRDLSPGKIDSISVFDLNADVKRKFTFSYSYFGNTASTANTDVRLKLDTVQEMSASKTDKKVYSFEYFDPGLVPSLTSYAQDYWGFYNGVGNSTLLPFVDPAIYGVYVASKTTQYGDRDPVFEKSRVGTLKKINYPTGGSTQFVYESHDYGYSPGGEVNEYKKTAKSLTATASRVGTINVPSTTLTFSINAAQTPTVTTSGSYSTFPLEDGPNTKLNRINANGTRTAILQRTLVNTLTTDYPNLAVGNYEIISTVDGTGQTATIDIKYYSLDTVLIKSKIAGGVRIKQVINYDPVTGLQQLKSYKYRLKSDTARSSGNLISDVNLITGQGPIAYGSGCGRLVRSSSSNNYLGSTQGSHVGYTLVTESDGDNLSNGWREVQYTSSIDYPNTYALNHQFAIQVDHVPFTYIETTKSLRYLTDYDFLRGLQTSEIYYNATGKKIKETSIGYNFSEAIDPASRNYYQTTMTAGYTVPVQTADPANTARQVEEYRVLNYILIAPWLFKTNSTETVYDANGENPLAIRTNYFYDNATHARLTRTETINSKKDTLKSLYKYPGDQLGIIGLSTTAATALTNMVASHKVSPVIEESHYKNSTFSTLKRTDYRTWDGSGKVIEPEHIVYKQLANPLDAVIDFLAYDTYSNVLSLAKSNDLVKSYLWDYKGNYPVAEVNNALQSDIAYTSFEADFMGNWAGVLSGNIQSLASLTGSKYYNLTTAGLTKTGLSSTSSYSVSYWSKNGAYNVAGTAPIKVGRIVTIAGNNWTYYEHLVTGKSSILVSGTGGIDELRLYPAAAQMTTITYIPLIGISSQCNANNQISYYEYDGLGRLKLIRDQDGMILKNYDYQYQKPITQ